MAEVRQSEAIERPASEEAVGRLSEDVSVIAEGKQPSPPPLFNRNVKVLIAQWVLIRVINSISLYGIFDTYLYEVSKNYTRDHQPSNTIVGVAESITGLTSLVMTIPAVCLLDRFERPLLMRVAAIVGTCAVVCFVIGIGFDQLHALYVGLCLWGIAGQSNYAVGEALYADAVLPGRRSKMNTIKASLGQLGFSLGPAIEIVMFYFLGNVWEIGPLHYVLLSGLIIWPLVIVFAFMTTNPTPHHPLEQQQRQQQPTSLASTSASDQTTSIDSGSDDSPHESLDRSYSQQNHNSVLSFDVDERHVCFLHQYSARRVNDVLTHAKRFFCPNRARQRRILADDTALNGNSDVERRRTSINNGLSTPLLDQDDHVVHLECDGEGDLPVLGGRTVAGWAVPILISMCDFTLAIGAGMTVKFFPLFFKNDYQLSPSGVCTVLVLQQLAMVVFMGLASRVTKRVGRPVTAWVMALIGCLCLYSLAYVTPFALFLALFLVRGGIQNARSPIDRSITMDYVPRRFRARWASIQGVTRFTWSGSAVLGGVIADTSLNGYRQTFLITAHVYTAAVLMYLPIILLVPQNEKMEHMTGDDQGGKREGAGEGGQPTSATGVAAQRS
ncbi:unnamed protein product [Vitrella brassicaformis CCMP3155]|uniref:Major facilitator superfamily (MFS) profile domain-containing protein n=2 Tax=Vitrella brassicaformis TaxID=1169539 RepID=A0A0G4GTB8_VITBC|nr:unnamed protein product [Vitrella brassicaformis CCMP3155]|eukprot:CEM34013.1 unnamed protein product [Vitrella brassicaformis CCMP3155]